MGKFLMLILKARSNNFRRVKMLYFETPNKQEVLDVSIANGDKGSRMN